MNVVFMQREKITFGRFYLTALKFPKSSDMVKVGIKCQRDESNWKRLGWNVINPMSEKPKIGRGTFMKESNGLKDVLVHR